MNDSMKNKCKDNFAVLSGRNNSFDWKKLLFHAGGTFVSCWWNKNFLLRNHLFHAEKTGEMSRHIFHNVLSAPNNPQTKKADLLFRVSALP